ncbi:hypothetical protein E2F48_14055 [Arthrobacter crusticola]|uniref:Uncharacterized protein n=1 Tax=Arthrobacter crusticola TaxID=2547960 RepID=A0A4R5TPB1_9MICC|nr:hypothetical protein [Arthrobacter crusticola]TDK23918.1 hypothetical protein E2F48_14055 [Arthrobacter crusticola]
MEQQIFSFIFGLFCLGVGVVSALLTPRINRARKALTKSISPDNPRRGLNAYGKITYTAFTIISLVMGVVFIAVSLFELATGVRR